MSAYNPGAIVPIAPIEIAVLVHDDPLQQIQGGIAGQHYHLTSTQHSLVAGLATTGIPIFEPVAISGELVYDGTGDVLVDIGGYYAP